jgi:dienelactone hydrolase
MRESRWLAASDLLKQAERYIPASPELIRLKDSVPSATVTIETEPTGADFYIRDYTSPEDEAWQLLGRSPITTDRLPGSYFPRGFYRVRAVKSGFATAEWAATLGRAGAPPLKIELRSEASVPSGMLWVPGGDGSLWTGLNTPEPITGFWIDRLEVTNRQFKEFVDHGGYRMREYWKEPFRSDGRPLTWEQAMSQFRDLTGQPGPSTWRLSDYPEGQADFPVGGVSWYEAAAYAEFAGKSLPTVYHWLYAGDTGPFSDAVNLGNFSGQGPASAGKYRSLGAFGTLDMAGNVQEWVLNANGDGKLRYTLGGAWNQPSYMAMNISDARPPFERQPYEGFRCVRYDSPPPSSLRQAIIPPNTDRRGEKPVDDQTYKIFQRLHQYDRADLNARVDGVVDRGYWRLENVSFQAAYNGERMIAHLYVPKNSAPPYQTVIYMGGVEILSIHHPDTAESAGLAFGFLLRSGRAVVVPVFKGTMERGPMPGPPGPSRSREMRIAWSKDLGRSIDYLEVRPDIDLTRLAFEGVSFGAGSSTHLVALEPRIKTLVLVSGGTELRLAPEVDCWNYAPRVTVPVLMINGREDFDFPLESSQLPLLRAFGTPAKDKKHVLFDGGHATPVAQPDLIKANLDWLDQYFGPVKLRN